jgi:hypothetical protein
VITVLYSSSPLIAGWILAFLTVDPSSPHERKTDIMNMKTGERWHCINPACRCEVLVQADSCDAGGQLLCVCGSPMKKKYSPPALTYLEFLRVEDPVSAREETRKG